MTSGTMGERPVNLKLKTAGEDLLALRAGASAGGVEVNEFILTTLRSHAEIQRETTGRNPHGGTMTGCIGTAG